MRLNFKVIIIGFIVTAATSFILGYFSSILGGLVVGYLIADDYRDGAINGAIASAIAGLLYGLFYLFLFARIFTTYSAGGGLAYFGIIFIAIESIIAGLILGGIGGVAGTFLKEKNEIRNTQQPRMTSKINGYLTCDKCGGYYKLQKGESPDDFEQCECGGKLSYNKLNPVRNKLKESLIKEYPQKILKSLRNQDKKKKLIIICVIALIISIPLILYVNQQTHIKYTLLGSYDAENLGINGTLVHIPQGTENIKVEYNISWKAAATGTNGFELQAYNINSGDKVPRGSHNLTNNKAFPVFEGQNKIGTYYFNNPQIKTIVIDGNGIQGTVNIYISQ